MDVIAPASPRSGNRISVATILLEFARRLVCDPTAIVSCRQAADMPRSVPLAIGVLLAGTGASLATANCQTRGPPFRVEQSDKATYRSTMNADGCRYVYARFQKAVIMKQPDSGTLSQIGEFSFLYKPKPGFKGQDSYVIYICAINYRGSGCSRLTYEAIVQ